MNKQDELLNALLEYCSPCGVCAYRLVFQHTDPPCVFCKFGVKKGKKFCWEKLTTDEDACQKEKDSKLAILKESK